MIIAKGMFGRVLELVVGDSSTDTVKLVCRKCEHVNGTQPKSETLQRKLFLGWFCVLLLV